jgi:monofunctional biosynthetic peptidoglycan transglycosylase
VGIAAKRMTARRIALGVLAAAVGWLLGVWPPPVWWRSHWPDQTAMMRLRDTAVGYTPVSLARLPTVLQRMVIIGEDSRFRTHHGLDFDEIRDAAGVAPDAGLGLTVRALWRHRDRVRGASTITQQLAKNLYLSPSRNPLRKVKEAVTALRLELALRKDRILELYLNLVEMGPDVWGMPAASERYFGVPPAGLSESQAAALAATLPFPLSSNPSSRPTRMLHRRDLILARYHGVDVYIPPEEETELLVVPESLPPVTPPVLDSIPRDSLPRDTVPRPLPPDTLPDSSRDTTARPGAVQSTRRRGITRAR